VGDAARGGARRGLISGIPGDRFVETGV